MSQSDSDGYDYVRSAYRLVFEVGDRVTIDGKPGVIVDGQGNQYVYVKLDESGYTVSCHPTWRLLLSRESDSA